MRRDNHDSGDRAVGKDTVAGEERRKGRRGYPGRGH